MKSSTCLSYCRSIDENLAYDDLQLTWPDNNTDPDCPLNWSKRAKWTITLLSSMGGLVTLMSGAMLAPALDAISESLGSSTDKTNMMLSIFVLSFAFGPMVLAPATEIFGRRPVWLVCSTWYVVWNTICGFADSSGLMLAARLLAGLGASAEFAVRHPSLSSVT
jgi:predicted MFS family arabinose efflux permease